MAFSYNKKNLANTTITGAITPTQTSVTVADATVFSYAFFYATLMPSNEMSNASNSEIVLVTNIQGNTLTLVRGQENTIARSFPYGAVITNGIYTRDIDYARSIGRKVFMAEDDGTDDNNTSYQIVDPMIKNIPEEGSIITVEFDTPSYGAPTLGVNNGIGGLVQVSGSNIHITDSSGQIDSVEIYGDTEQETVSGKNLLDVFAYLTVGNTVSSNGVDMTLNANGTLTISGTATGGNSQLYITNGGASLPAANNKIVLEMLSGTITGGEGKIWAYSFDNNFFGTAVASLSAVGIASGACNVQTATQTRFRFTVNQGVSVNGVFRVMFEDVSENNDYEPYCGGTASPNPDYPQTVQTVTGEQTITISDGGSQSQNYTVDLGSIELCKIGDYQDYIYKDNGDWYIHKETGKHIVVSNEPSIAWDSARRRLTFLPTGWGIVPSTSSADVIKAVSDMFIAGSTDYVATNLNNGMCLSTGGYISLRFGEWTSQSDALSQAVGAKIYYALETPTDTQITDENLIEQLNALYNMLPEGVADVVVTGDLAGSLTIKYYQQGTGTYTAPIVGGAEIDGGDNEQVVELDSYLPYRLVYDTNGYWRVLNKGPKVTTGAIMDGAVTPAKLSVDPGKYSTAETIIGSWIDGRPVYRKVLTGTTPEGGAILNHGISNFSRILNVGGWVQSGSFGSQPIQRVLTDALAGYGIGVGDFTSTTFLLQVGSDADIRGKPYTLILEYIKTV